MTDHPKHKTYKRTPLIYVIKYYFIYEYQQYEIYQNATNCYV